MLALALLCALAAPVSAAPADPVDAAQPDHAGVVARIRVARVNGVEAAGAGPLWPLDDVVLTADESKAVDGIASYTWALLEAPADTEVSLTRPDAVETGFAFHLKNRRVAGLPGAGRYRVRLTVTSASGHRAVAETALIVGWPGGHAPPSSRSLPAPDGPLGFQPSRGTMGAAIGCCAASGLTAALTAMSTGLGAGANGATCGVVVCGPCATAGALGGAAGAVLDHEGGDLNELSPWVLTGVGAELAGVVLLGSAFFASLSLGGLGGVPGPSPAAQAAITATGVAGVGLVLLGGPITVFALGTVDTVEETTPVAPPR